MPVIQLPFKAHASFRFTKKANTKLPKPSTVKRKLNKLKTIGDIWEKSRDSTGPPGISDANARNEITSCVDKVLYILLVSWEVGGLKY